MKQASETDLFVYGTLRHAVIRRAVLGADLDAASVRLASLPDFTVCKVAGASYPMLVAASGQRAEGLLLCGLNRAQIDRLDRFETEDYKRQACRVILEDADGLQAAAYAYMPAGHLRADGRWDFESWCQDGLARFLAEDFAEDGVRRV